MYNIQFSQGASRLQKRRQSDSNSLLPPKCFLRGLLQGGDFSGSCEGLGAAVGGRRNFSGWFGVACLSGRRPIGILVGAHPHTTSQTTLLLVDLWPEAAHSKCDPARCRLASRKCGQGVHRRRHYQKMGIAGLIYRSKAFNAVRHKRSSERAVKTPQSHMYPRSANYFLFLAI